MKTLLITGGAGFIGSITTSILYEAGYQTVVLDNLSKGNRLAVPHGEFIEGDIFDSEEIFKKFHFDGVIHLAALTDVGESVANPLLYYKNNVEGTLCLLKAMENNKVDKLIFSSTASVYGYDAAQPLTETTPVDPLNPYGKSKLMIEKILENMKTIKSIRFRYFNAAGGDPKKVLKNYKQKENNLIPLIIQAIKDNKEMTIYGDDYNTPDGTCVRDYIHIADLAEAHKLGIEKLFNGSNGGLFCLGNGNGFSVTQVFEAAEQVLNVKISRKMGKRRPGDPPVLIASSEKAKKELSWTPRHPKLSEIILDAWAASQIRS